MPRLLSLALASVIGLGLSVPAVATPYTYTAFDLGNVIASGINDSGQVTGRYVTNPYPNDSEPIVVHAFITGRNGSGFTDIGALPRGPHSFGAGINNSGQVAGYSGNDTHVAFVTGTNGKNMTTVLGPLPGANGESAARAINNAGQVAGEFNAFGGHQAFITGPNGKGVTIIGEPFGSTFAWAVNNAGQVTGQSNSQAFITGRNGEGLTYLGTLGGAGSTGLGINDAGQVVGASDVAGSNFSHAFMTGPNGTGMIDLGTLGGFFSTAYDINNRGQVVGVYGLGDPAGNSVFHAFITGPNGVEMRDLNTLVDLPGDAYLAFARGINDRGQIIADASNGRAYLISPFAIPEPETGALVFTSLGLMGFMARRKKGSQQQAVTV